MLAILRAPGVSQLIRVFDGHDERMSERDELRQHREELRRRYGAAYNRLSSLLFEEDPVGINFEHNADEYEPEAGTILPRLRSCGSVADVREVVHSEFLRWFDAETAGPVDRYQSIAERVWLEVVPVIKASA